jgi:hypothetical protein
LDIWMRLGNRSFPSDQPFGYRNVMQFHPLPNGENWGWWSEIPKPFLNLHAVCCLNKLFKIFCLTSPWSRIPHHTHWDAPEQRCGIHDHAGERRGRDPRDRNGSTVNLVHRTEMKVSS